MSCNLPPSSKLCRPLPDAFPRPGPDAFQPATQSRQSVLVLRATAVCIVCALFNKPAQRSPVSQRHGHVSECLGIAGITACFVNVGSDHPSLLEAIVKGKRERPGSWPRMITCPSEVTAISMADGYARVSGRPQAVLVHVDVGTQAMGQGIHNASVGRAPVLILAGLCPYTESGELPGSRTEYMHWLQEAPDQKAIVGQYCRYTGQVHTGLNVKQMLAQGPVVPRLCPRGPGPGDAAVLARPGPPGALPADAVADISAALVRARRPLVVTGYSGRDRRTPELLVALADLIPGIRVHDTGGSDMCFPFSHVASEGFSLGTDDCTRDADVVLLLDCDVPWIPSLNPPPKTARIYHVDSDPLNQQIPVSLFPAHGRWRAESYTALTQLVKHIEGDAVLTTTLGDGAYAARHDARSRVHRARLASIASRPRLGADEALDADNIGSLLKTCWKAPRNSARIVYPAGLSASASDDEINCSFRPTPNFAALAEAAAGSEVGWGQATDDAWMKGVRVRTAGHLKEALECARSRLLDDDKAMLIEVLL
ncbi:thiamine pyrophosphate enzyme [Ophiocordyceps sinensis CO18]|uniref:Thiamine pyrophosphate enzyme n=1 Tax=Ophiocordyceps sinensis (strain Co18 / CGMCC 3.14243) TaxID=911162 RepID=T5ACC3_OPHSC|nr:thiamine pyrophosphate enzyme [Ophiocordyceps sinensis CO18]